MSTAGIQQRLCDLAPAGMKPAGADELRPFGGLTAEEIEADDSASFQIGRYFHLGKTIHFSGFEGSVLIYLF